MFIPVLVIVLMSAAIVFTHFFGKTFAIGCFIAMMISGSVFGYMVENPKQVHVVEAN